LWLFTKSLRTMSEQNGLGQIRVGPDPANVVEELSAPKLIALHLIQGALVTVAFVPFAPLVQAAGLPPIGALLVAILLVFVPVELGIVLLAVRRDGGAAAVAFPGRSIPAPASNAEAVVAGQHVNEQIRPTSAGTRNDQRAVISAEVAFRVLRYLGGVLSRHQGPCVQRLGSPSPLARCSG
jgi:hypothetical protein